MNHDIELLQNFNIYEYIDHALSDFTLDIESRYSLWPSDASAIIKKDKYFTIEGGCHRAIFYRMKKVSKTNPITNYARWTHKLGKALETEHVDLLKRMGLFKANNVKFWLSELSMSGEIDIVIRHPEYDEKIILCECKSTYGYNAEKEIFGNKSIVGKPKLSHIMQLASYLYAFRDNPNIIGGKLLYFLRDNTKRKEYNVTLSEIDGQYIIFVNGKRLEEFTYNDVIDRFNILDKHFKNNSLPPRDYSILYTDEDMEIAFKMGKITEKAYTEFLSNPVKSNRKGDWQCSYCEWKDKCYSDNPEIT